MKESMNHHEEREAHEGQAFEALSRQVIGCAIEVHRFLGPGLLESSDPRYLSRELELNEMAHVCEAPLPIKYKGISLDCGYRVDVLVEGALIVELKSVKKIDPIHEAQILTYMKLSGIPTSLMFNFNVTRLKDGMKSYVL
ncbi:MAG: GxxExxY protein [Opitutales bacterium]